MASLPPPTDGRHPFRGNALVDHITGNSPPARFDQIRQGRGDLHNNSLGRFEGFFAATTWGNGHCLYCHPRPEDAHSGAMHFLLTSWATPHPLSLIKFVEGGEIYITIYQSNLRGFLLPQHGATDIYRPRPEDARSGSTHLLPAPWATHHPLGSIKFVEGGRPVPGQRAHCPHHG